MMKPPNKGHLQITDKTSCTNLSVTKRFNCTLVLAALNSTHNGMSMIINSQLQ